MTTRPLLAAVGAGLLLVACAPDAPQQTTAPTTSAPAAQPDVGDPVPVEGDGSIGGEGGGAVTSNLIVSSDERGADQVEVVATCLVGSEPPTYRLELAQGGVLTVVTGDGGGRIELTADGTTFRSPEDQPPVATAGDGALSVQARALADDGDERFVDAVIGLDDLPDC